MRCERPPVPGEAWRPRAWCSHGGSPRGRSLAPSRALAPGRGGQESGATDEAWAAAWESIWIHASELTPTRRPTAACLPDGSGHQGRGLCGCPWDLAEARSAGGWRRRALSGWPPQRASGRRAGRHGRATTSANSEQARVNPDARCTRARARRAWRAPRSLGRACGPCAPPSPPGPRHLRRRGVAAIQTAFGEERPAPGTFGGQARPNLPHEERAGAAPWPRRRRWRRACLEGARVRG